MFPLLLFALLLADQPAPNWHDAKVVAVQHRAIFRYFDIIDSHDPHCRLKYREIRNPFNSLTLREGTTVKVAGDMNGAIDLIDERGHRHKGRLLLQALMLPTPPPPPKP